VVDEAFAKQYFPGENPIGKIIRMRYEPYKVEEAQPRTIIGVVGEVKFYRRSQRAMPIVYASNLQQPDLYPGGRTSAHRVRRLLLRTKSDVDTDMQALVTSVRSIVAALDKNVPVAEIKTMDTVLRDTDQFTRYYARLLSIFGVLAAILAAIGIYGVMSYLVSERTREIGVRTALGAPRGAVMRLILVKSLTLTAIGVACGVVGAFALTRLLAELLFGVTPLDPVTYAAVVLVLGSIALAAGYLPARRASKLDPLVALRHD
jgi:putative ABC transport system permease protein